LQIRGIRSAGPGDDQARFLADLRALRDSAAIGHDELAARAHYPTDILQEAENGPRLPGLPILTAYVRACEGDVLDWEERWRQLNAEVPEDPSLPVRPPGASAAAVAGARAGVSVAPPDVYDPDRIRAALRGGRSPSQQASRRNGNPGLATPVPGAAGTEVFAGGLGSDPAAETAAAAGAPWDAAGWDAGADPTITTTNGNHSAGSDGHGPFSTAYAEAGYAEDRYIEDTYIEDTYAEAPHTEDTYAEGTYTEAPYAEGADNAGSMADPAGSVTPAQDGGSVWLPESEPEPGDSGAALAPGDGDFDWLKRPGAGREARPGESNVMWSEAEEQATPVPAEPVAAEPVAGEPVAGEPRVWQQDSIMKPPQREDFWATPSPAASDLQPPAVTQASWAAAGEATPAPPAASAVPPPAVADPAAAPPQVDPQDPAHGQAPGQAQVSVPPQSGKPDRLFSVKLIVVIIIAALIGSALVLLLK
jgi:hypothetical protein